MANIPAAYALSVHNGSVVTREDLYEIGLKQTDYKVKPGDVLEVPCAEDLCFKKMCIPGIPGYDIYTVVRKNGHICLILVYRCRINKNGTKIALYDLATRFRYSGNVYDCLTFLGDLGCPVIVTEDGVIW